MLTYFFVDDNKCLLNFFADDNKCLLNFLLMIINAYLIFC